VKALFDSSVIVAALWAGHPLHDPAKSWVVRSRSVEISALMCQHSLMEVFASLTGMPSRPKLGPAAVRAALDEALKSIEVVALTPADYRSCLSQAEKLGISGGICYDLLILHTAQKAKVDCLITGNARDFQRLWTGDPSFIEGLR
jgi:predicted nucleic acid-binding protein